MWNDKTLSEHLEERARDLRARFRRDFWIPERGCHALALDGDERQVDSLTSNIGHLLWSGILDESEAAATAERLLEEQLYSGWGVRTPGHARGGLQHHTGTIWPNDNSLIAAGLARYGHPRGSRHDRLLDPRRSTLLRTPPAGGLRRLPGRTDICARGIPHGITSPGLGRRRATAAPHGPRCPPSRIRSHAIRYALRAG